MKQINWRLLLGNGFWLKFEPTRRGSTERTREYAKWRLGGKKTGPSHGKPVTSRGESVGSRDRLVSAQALHVVCVHVSQQKIWQCTDLFPCQKQEIQEVQEKWKPSTPCHWPQTPTTTICRPKEEDGSSTGGAAKHGVVQRIQKIIGKDHMKLQISVSEAKKSAFNVRCNMMQPQSKQLSEQTTLCTSAATMSPLRRSSRICRSNWISQGTHHQLETKLWRPTYWSEDWLCRQQWKPPFTLDQNYTEFGSIQEHELRGNSKLIQYITKTDIGTFWRDSECDKYSSFMVEF